MELHLFNFCSMAKLENRYLGYMLRVKVPIRILAEDKASGDELARQLQAHPISISLNFKSQAKLEFNSGSPDEASIQTEVSMMDIQQTIAQKYRHLSELILYFSENETKTFTMSTSPCSTDTEWAEVDFLLTLRFTKVLPGPLKSQINEAVVKEIMRKRRDIFQKVYERMVRESSKRLDEPTSFKGLRRTVPGTSVNADKLSNVESRLYIMETISTVKAHRFNVSQLYPPLKAALPGLVEVRGDDLVFLVLKQKPDGNGINMVYLFRNGFLENICAYYSDEGLSERQESNFREKLTGILESTVLKGFEVLLQAIWSLNPY